MGTERTRDRLMRDREKNGMEDGCQNEREEDNETRGKKKRMAIFNHQHSLHNTTKTRESSQVHGTPTTT